MTYLELGFGSLKSNFPIKGATASHMSKPPYRAAERNGMRIMMRKGQKKSKSLSIKLRLIFPCDQ